MAMLTRGCVWCTVMVALSPWSVAIAQQATDGHAAIELQQHYEKAQNFQQTGKLSEAGREYRLFLSEALSQMARGEAHIGHYDKAASLLDTALTLVPGSPSVESIYAQTALDAGDLPQAEKLARALLEQKLAPEESAQAHEILGRTLLRMNRDPEARRELEAAVALNPDFANQYNLAIACTDLDDAPCTAKIFAELLATYGDSPKIHMDFGRAWGQSDFQSRAEQEFATVIAEDPRFPEAHYCLAVTYLQENEATKITAAVSELHQAVAVDPKDTLAWAALGKLAATRQEYPEARKDLSRAIEIGPEQPDAWLYLGQVDFNTNHPVPAERELRQAIRLTTDPSRNHYQIQQGYYLLGRILQREGKSQEAASVIKVAKDLLQRNLAQDRSRLNGLKGNASPGTSGAQAPLKFDTAASQTKVFANPAAARELENYRRQIGPAIADSFNNLGDIAAGEKNYDEALSCFQQAASWNPSLAGLDLNEGRAAFMASKFSDAVPPLTRYLRTHPSSNNIRAVLGISQFMTEDYRGCIATLQPAESKLDSVAQIAYVYADSLLKTGHRTTALARLVKLETQHPEIADVHRALGEAYAEGPDRQKALSELSTAARLDPSSSETHRELGRVFLQENDTDSAIRQLQSAVQLSPADPESHKLLAEAYRSAARMDDANREQRTYDSLQQAAPPVSSGPQAAQNGATPSQNPE